jgi:hypothetical protein
MTGSGIAGAIGSGIIGGGSIIRVSLEVSAVLLEVSVTVLG